MLHGQFLSRSRQSQSKLAVGQRLPRAAVSTDFIDSSTRLDRTATTGADTRGLSRANHKDGSTSTKLIGCARGQGGEGGGTTAQSETPLLGNGAARYKFPWRQSAIYTGTGTGTSTRGGQHDEGLRQDLHQQPHSRRQTSHAQPRGKDPNHSHQPRYKVGPRYHHNAPIDHEQPPPNPNPPNLPHSPPPQRQSLALQGSKIPPRAP